MDKQVKKFLLSERATSTDSSHKCVAKKFYNWMLQCRSERDSDKKISLTRKQYKAFGEQQQDEPPYQLPEELIKDNIFARFLLYCLVELKSKKSSLRAAHGQISFVCKDKLKSMRSTECVYTKIKNKAVYKEHIPKKALVPKPSVHVNIGVRNSTSLHDSYSIFMYNLAMC